jgi:hypothetical protein
MKSYAVTFAGVLVFGLAAVSVLTVYAQNGPTIPEWVRPGLVVVYDGVSAFVSNGRFTQGIQIVLTTRVNTVAGGQVAGVTQVQTVGSPVGGTHAWTCNAAANCTTDATGFHGKFWVDPANPTASIRGANGETYSIMGSAPYSYNGKTWAATTMSYQNPATGWQLMCIFETKTGLMLAYSETSPAQQAHTYYRSMNGQ